MSKYLTLISLLIMSAFSVIGISEWRIVEGYSIRFDGKYARGTFHKMEGAIRFDPEQVAASYFDVSVDAASIDTGIELKNKHARSDKWFDAEKYPRIHFRSSIVSKTDTGFVVRGELEMRGIKKEIQIPFGFHRTDSQSQFYGRFKVNRGDFGIGKVNGKDSDSTSVEIFVPVNTI